MNPCRWNLIVLCATAALTLATDAVAQNQSPAPPPAPVSPPRRRILSDGQGNSSEFAKPLSANYRLAFSGKSGDKPMGELSVLTCSPLVRLEGPLDASKTPTSFGISGTLEEKEDGTLLFGYQLSFSLPVANSTMTAPGQTQGQMINYQYQNHSSSGSLLMKPGHSYELLRSGGAVYSVTISAEADK